MTTFEAPLAADMAAACEWLRRTDRPPAPLPGKPVSAPGAAPEDDESAAD
jgi:hypothetical protein